ncbi:hypothetical protein DCCM_2754 [Desulfocucumis palustris]|uniref:Uncharacterized protein n=1 Tax=Desulfocucumis palustris TaxID=1898651 RepID=A0A2L2XBQ0_9FIRM|nr:hypothetical protein DCCM_2754 [Desulfocucumis palustris]
MVKVNMDLACREDKAIPESSPGAWRDSAGDRGVTRIAPSFLLS